MNYWTQSAKNIFVAGHRGWYDKYPENTMEGFRAALELGVDQI
ncbi:MAG: glycerophosphodiester phosphodiesterase, partial [Lachnospiraceae bacterium]|nr:glycerophosphodiester phosphodiesterase [Lachnospiraceae bacterium]